MTALLFYPTCLVVAAIGLALGAHLAKDAKRRGDADHSRHQRILGKRA